jgi:hypothetical protein
MSEYDAIVAGAGGGTLVLVGGQTKVYHLLKERLQ